MIFGHNNSALEGVYELSPLDTGAVSGDGISGSGTRHVEIECEALVSVDIQFRLSLLFPNMLDRYLALTISSSTRQRLSSSFFIEEGVCSQPHCSLKSTLDLRTLANASCFSTRAKTAAN